MRGGWTLGPQSVAKEERICQQSGRSQASAISCGKNRIVLGQVVSSIRGIICAYITKAQVGVSSNNMNSCKVKDRP